MYEALNNVKARLRTIPSRSFKKAIDNVKPVPRSRAGAGGGSNYQVPIEVNPTRPHVSGSAVAGSATLAPAPSATMVQKLAGEIMDAAGQRGRAVKKKDDTDKMAEANKAFAHYRW